MKRCIWLAVLLGAVGINAATRPLGFLIHRAVVVSKDNIHKHITLKPECSHEELKDEIAQTTAVAGLLDGQGVIKLYAFIPCEAFREGAEFVQHSSQKGCRKRVNKKRFVSHSAGLLAGAAVLGGAWYASKALQSPHNWSLSNKIFPVIAVCGAALSYYAAKKIADLPRWWKSGDKQCYEELSEKYLSVIQNGPGRSDRERIPFLWAATRLSSGGYWSQVCGSLNSSLIIGSPQADANYKNCVPVYSITPIADPVSTAPSVAQSLAPQPNLSLQSDRFMYTNPAVHWLETYSVRDVKASIGDVVDFTEHLEKSIVLDPKWPIDYAKSIIYQRLINGVSSSLLRSFHASCENVQYVSELVEAFKEFESEDRKLAWTLYIGSNDDVRKKLDVHYPNFQQAWKKVQTEVVNFGGCNFGICDMLHITVKLKELGKGISWKSLPIDSLASVHGTVYEELVGGVNEAISEAIIEYLSKNETTKEFREALERYMQTVDHINSLLEKHYPGEIEGQRQRYGDRYAVFLRKKQLEEDSPEV